MNFKPKTQRDKDWPMISRLVQTHFFQRFPMQATHKTLQFWFAELRSPTLLLQLAREFPGFNTKREAALLAFEGADECRIERALRAEEERERELDRIYWRPLKAELETIRLARSR